MWLTQKQLRRELAGQQRNLKNSDMVSEHKSWSDLSEVQKARRYRRPGGTEGQEIQKVRRYRRPGGTEGQEVQKVRRYRG